MNSVVRKIQIYWIPEVVEWIVFDLSNIFSLTEDKISQIPIFSKIIL